MIVSLALEPDLLDWSLDPTTYELWDLNNLLVLLLHQTKLVQVISSKTAVRKLPAI